MAICIGVAEVEFETGSVGGWRREEREKGENGSHFISGGQRGECEIDALIAFPFREYEQKREREG
jgi:hypothetical protein